MSTAIHQRIQQEIELIERFSGSYGRKFNELIGRMNQCPTALPDGQCLRMCIEAVNMVLSLQGHLAHVLDDLSRLSADSVN